MTWADERSELQWKAQALVSKAETIRAKIGEQNLIDLQNATNAIQQFAKELDAMGLMMSQATVGGDVKIVEKPKPIPEPKKEEPKKPEIKAK